MAENGNFFAKLKKFKRPVNGVLVLFLIYILVRFCQKLLTSDESEIYWHQGVFSFGSFTALGFVATVGLTGLALIFAYLHGIYYKRKQKEQKEQIKKNLRLRGR